MFAYAIREYRQGGRLGRIETFFDRAEEIEEGEDEEIPYHESDKIEWICDRIELDASGVVHGEDIRELIGEVDAASRTVYYRTAVLDRLGFVHHPETHGLYIPRDRVSEYGLSEDDLAIERKPYEALTREEKIEGIQTLLQREGGVLSANEIHGPLFGGKGSVTHMRNLAQDVANDNGFTYRETSGGTKVLRAIDSSQGDGETEQMTITEADNRGHQQRVETLTAIDQQDGDELDQEERVEKVRLGVTWAAMQRQRNIAENGVTDIQELFDGAIDEETASQLMHAATDAAGFDIVDGFSSEKLRVIRAETDPAIQTVASSPPEAIPESTVATEKQFEPGSESEPADATEGEDDDGDETDPPPPGGRRALAG